MRSSDKESSKAAYKYSAEECAFYEKYSNRLQLTAQQKSDFDSLVRTYRQDKPTVGQPVQRGVWVFMGLFLELLGIINQAVGN